MDQGKQRVEQIDAGRISEFTEGEDRAVWPERDAGGEVLDERQMQRQIAKIIRRLNFQFTPIDVQQPAKRSHSEHRETDCDGPKPNTAIAHQR